MTEHSSSAQLAQSISALTDNEATELEIARILKASATDPEVGATWHCYHVARAAMKGELDSHFTVGAADFAARVSAAVDAEPVPSAGKTVTRWWQNAGRFAVAASVAGAVVIGAQLYQDQSIEAPAMASGEATTAPVAAAEVSVPVGFNAPELSVRPVSAQMNYESPRRQVVFESRQADAKVSNEQIRHYLNQLVESHTNHAAVNGAQGMLPFARIPLSEEE
ncbi:MAG TPA: sigma-E factor negative regulatory protein [Cellvibrionaceae bacterium]